MRKPHLIAAAGALALALPSAAHALPTPSAAFDFSSSSGATTTSTGASPINLRLDNGATVSGGTLVLDGNDDLTDARSNVFYTSVTGDFAISVKARSTGWGTAWQPLAFQDDDFYGTYSWAVYGTTSPAGTVHAYVRMREGATLQTLDLEGSPGRLLIDATFHQIGLSVSGNAAKLYFDGTLADAQTSTLPTATVHLGPDHMFIGGDEYGGEHFQGYMDDVRYFKQALTATDMAHLAST